ncbi:hypothetical protein DUI87_00435 [Hirundo rustica rustica]|uniref:Uncharacterized protein n=1 Tax=Hirundo rustica rustica TaxID=333673 RepID=A0A3M0LHU5_HIRRU|nr:hypothetical protein DUI87_00435 [Hirundo rustica rustica]
MAGASRRAAGSRLLGAAPAAPGVVGRGSGDPRELPGADQESFLLANVLPAPGGDPASPRRNGDEQEELIAAMERRLEIAGSGESSPEFPENDAADAAEDADPEILHRLFEGESEAESFYGFEEEDLELMEI